MTAKEKHKELKKKVNELEKLRSVDRSINTWKEIRELKKKKLKEKDKLEHKR
jgi:hypothetical protein